MLKAEPEARKSAARKSVFLGSPACPSDEKQSNPQPAGNVYFDPMGTESCAIGCGFEGIEPQNAEKYKDFESLPLEDFLTVFNNLCFAPGFFEGKPRRNHKTTTSNTEN